RWAMGNRIGFEFVGSQAADRATPEWMRVPSDTLPDSALRQFMDLLRSAQYHDEKNIRNAAMAAETAVRQLQNLLREGRAVTA
ncbi:MAG: hypothetical protein POH28_09680, partial [Acidocella sp.]|nr:hypothetical protein [Acidocella sp.]